MVEDYHRTLMSANAQGHSPNLNRAHEIGPTLLGHDPRVKELQEGRAGLQALVISLAFKLFWHRPVS